MRLAGVRDAAAGTGGCDVVHEAHGRRGATGPVGDARRSVDLVSRATVPQGVVDVRPANEASWDDLVAVFGERGYPAVCWCQRQVLGDRVWYGTPPEERARLLHEQTSCGDPDAPATSGLVAYLDGEPAGWVAVGPRPSYRRLRGSPVPWKGRPVAASGH